MKRFRFVLPVLFAVSILLTPVNTYAQTSCQGNFAALNVNDFGVISTYGYPDTFDDSGNGWFKFYRAPENMTSTAMGSYIYGTACKASDPVTSYHETRYDKLKEWGGQFDEQAQSWSGVTEVAMKQFGDESSAYMRTADWNPNAREVFVIMRRGNEVAVLTLGIMNNFKPEQKAEGYTAIMASRL